MANSSSIPQPNVPSHLSQCVAEFCGTLLLVFLGCGVVHTAVLFGSQSGIWQVAVVWGIAVMLAIYCVGAISGAHLNPAVTISMACWGRHPWSRVVTYVLSQFSGAFVAAAILFFIFQSALIAKELEKEVRRGEPGSIVTAMCYGEYFPSPGGLASATGPMEVQRYEELRAKVSPLQAALAECFGTLLLTCIIFALTDEKNANRPQANMAPIFIGLTVSALISVVAPLTQAGFNPARDLAPRCFAYLAGWGSVAFETGADGGWLTVYVVAPIVGAVVGGGVYRWLLRSNSI